MLFRCIASLGHIIPKTRLTAGDGFESSETTSVQAEVLPSLPISTALFRSALPTAIGYFAATT